jgi:hypothetical protein
MKTRKALEIFPEDFDAVTFLKPHSGEYENFLFVVYEDAYGEIYGSLVEKRDIKERFGLSDAQLKILEMEL